MSLNNLFKLGVFLCSLHFYLKPSVYWAYLCVNHRLKFQSMNYHEWSSIECMAGSEEALHWVGVEERRLADDRDKECVVYSSLGQ